MGRKLAPTVALVALLAAGCGSAQSTQSRPDARSGPSPRSRLPRRSTLTPRRFSRSRAPWVSPASPRAHRRASASTRARGRGRSPSPCPTPRSARSSPPADCPATTRRPTLTPNGLAVAPINAPLAVQNVIAAGNQIAHLPYRFGGGHGTFEDNAYDCSGSLSFVFAAAGLLNTTVTSGQLMTWGKPGPGKWITVFAAPGHTFMYVGGPAVRHGRAGRDRLALVKPLGQRARHQELRRPASRRAVIQRISRPLRRRRPPRGAP